VHLSTEWKRKGQHTKIAIKNTPLWFRLEKNKNSSVRAGATAAGAWTGQKLGNREMSARVWGPSSQNISCFYAHEALACHGEGFENWRFFLLAAFGGGGEAGVVLAQELDAKFHRQCFHPSAVPWLLLIQLHLLSNL
jgi:hypothetical protein